jgi:hypothetical protein
MTQALSRSSFRFHRHPGLVHRPAGERFHSRHGWLDSWHSFSFAGHYDPRWSGFGPLLVINDDTIQAGTGFGLHPHRHMEIITVMVEGELTHRDSLGHTQTLTAGEVQVLSAGSGILHSEMNEGQRPCRLLQIWIEPESRDVPPAYDQRRVEIGSGWTALIDPDRAGAAMDIHRPARLWRARPAPEGALTLPVAPGSLGWLQVIDGVLRVEVETDRGLQTGQLERGDGLGFQPGAIRSITAVTPHTDVLLFELR